MSTSGSYSHTRNRDQIIGDALRKIGAIASGETPDSQTVDDAAAALNGMVRHWQGIGIHIWTMAEATLFLQADQVQYTLSSTSTDHCTESYVQTTLTADKATSSTALPLTSTTGMTAADYIGIQVDDDAELTALRKQIEAADLPVIEEGETVCCYAKSDKSWVQDPAGMAWEAYRTMEDAQVFSGKSATAESACCAPQTMGTPECCEPSEKTAGCCG